MIPKEDQKSYMKLMKFSRGIKIRQAKNTTVLNRYKRKPERKN